MDWIDVDDELPENNDVVSVLCMIRDPVDAEEASLVPWQFQGMFNRNSGWHVYFLPGHIIVVGWKPLDDWPLNVINYME